MRGFLRFVSVILLVFLVVLSTGCKPGDSGGNGGNGTGGGNTGGEGGNTDNGDTSSKWTMWTNSTRLRGANIYQRKVYPELDGGEFMGPGAVGPTYRQEDFDRLAALGANYVNISHPGIFTENPPYQLSQEILNNLNGLINMARNADLFVVISFRTGPGRSEFTFFWGEDGDWFDASYYNDRVWIDTAAHDAWVEMWKTTARELKTRSNVVGYDLMVEPNTNDVYFDIWQPDEFYPAYAGTTYDWNILYPRIITAIREEDDQTPVLAACLSYSVTDWLPYLQVVSDSKTVYMFHQYEPFVYTHQEIGANITYPGNMDLWEDGNIVYIGKNWLAGLMATVDNFKEVNQVPVGCNEYGLVRWAPNGSVFMDDLMELFEQGGLNYALWNWGPSYDAYTSEVNAFNFRFGPDPNNTSDVDTSDLLEVIKKYWVKNTHRPSNVEF